jgi:hypothetical protein
VLSLEVAIMFPPGQAAGHGYYCSVDSHRARQDRSRHEPGARLYYGVPVFTDDVASLSYPVFKGPATL